MARVAVIGCGSMGALHARALLTRGAELLCSDPVPDRARELATALDATAVDGLADALDHGPDAAVVTTPTLNHPEVVRPLLEARVPTFCEKPLALTLEDTLALGGLADERGVLLQVGFQRRFDRGYVGARDAVRAGEVGRVTVVRAGTHEAPPPRGPVAVSGSVLRDLLIHDFDAVRFVTGAEVVTVSARGVDAAEEDGQRDWTAVASLLDLSDGSVAVVTGGRPQPPGYDARLEVFGSTGSVAAGLDDQTPLRARSSTSAPVYQSFRDRFPDAYEAEMTAFLQAAAGAGENRCGWEDAYASMRIAVAAERSVEEARRVAVDELP